MSQPHNPCPRAPEIGAAVRPHADPELRRHLAECPHCRADHQSTLHLGELARSLPWQAPDAERGPRQAALRDLRCARPHRRPGAATLGQSRRLHRRHLLRRLGGRRRRHPRLRSPPGVGPEGGAGRCGEAETTAASFETLGCGTASGENSRTDSARAAAPARGCTGRREGGKRSCVSPRSLLPCFPSSCEDSVSGSTSEPRAHASHNQPRTPRRRPRRAGLRRGLEGHARR